MIKTMFAEAGQSDASQPRAFVEIDELSDFSVGFLVEAAKQGDDIAFSILVKQYTGYVYSVVLKKAGSWRDVDDIVQEVFIRAWQKLDQLDDPDKFVQWIHTIAVHHTINCRIRDKAMLCVEDPNIFKPVSDRQMTPPEILMEEERDDALRGIISDMKPNDRKSLREFYWDQKSLKQMSTEIPEGTVKRRLHTARNRLHDAVVASSAFDESIDNQQ